LFCTDKVLLNTKKLYSTSNFCIVHVQVFLKTAEALKIKGIVDCAEIEAAADLRRPSTSSLSQASPPPPTANAAALELLPTTCPSDASPAGIPPQAAAPLQHPAGDLSLLATAAASALAAAAAAAAVTQPSQTTTTMTGVLMDYGAGAGSVLPNPKRRKTAPRKLGSFLSSSPAHEPFRSARKGLKSSHSSCKYRYGV
jgi:hypothetical protein